MARKAPSSSERRITASLIASFFVVLTGLVVPVILAVAAAVSPMETLLFGIVMFGAVASIPLAYCWPSVDIQVFPRQRRSFWSRLRAAFSRPPAPPEPPKHRYWKRRRGQVSAQPFGSEHRTFVPDRPDPDPI